MSFKISYNVSAKLPKLGWVATVDKNNALIEVTCGNWVECQKEWFVSGAWDGDFLEAAFSSAEFFCATGAKIENEEVVFYSPTHERQRICYFKEKNSITLSNSIPLLLAATDNRIDKDCDQYEKILCSILLGTKEYTRKIPIEKGLKITQIFCADIHLDECLNIKVVPKRTHRDFTDYRDYFESICNVCKKIKENGIDGNRIHTYELAATASSGYDSNACAAILKQVGCDTLMTFKGGYYDKDSAVAIAKQLGYNHIIERDCNEYKNKSNNKDAEFFVCGDIGVYLQFSAFENDFTSHIVSIGTSGSYIWDKTGDVNPESKRSGYDFYTANLSFSENALIKGYIVLPLPLYASTAVQSIQRISNLPEMKPWTLYNNYDRPICRRILETSGVDGNLFGHKKFGAGFALSKNFTLKQISRKMSIVGYNNFVIWLSERENNLWPVKRCFRMLQYHVSSFPFYLSYVASRLHIKTKMGQGLIKYPNPGLPAKLIVWGMETLTSKYSEAFKK